MAAADAQPVLGWRIGEFADRVGVPAATLRAWERRYAVLQPDRTPAGYRMYTVADEERLAALLSHLRQGLSPARAAERVALTSTGAGDSREPAAIVDQLMAAVAAYDDVGVATALDAAFLLGIAPGLRDVLLPALVRIGEAWARDELTVGHEHFATNLIERRLAAESHGWERGSGPVALLACPSGERHTLGLQCAGLCLAELGWRIVYLGADTPVEEVHRLARATSATVVLLCALEEGRFLDARDAVLALARSHTTVLAGAGATAEVARGLNCRLAPGNPAVVAEAASFALTP